MTIIDANVLLYTHNEDAEHHRKSLQWMQRMIESGELIGIPWHSAMAFLRITSTPGVMLVARDRRFCRNQRLV